MTDKERLEGIKRMWHEDGDIDDKAFYWLIEQAERVQELESELNKQIEIGYKFEGEVYDLAKENKRYREALEEVLKTGDYEDMQDYIDRIVTKACQALEGE